MFLLDKYKVTVTTNKGERNLPVFIALLADGTQNNIKLPKDVDPIYDGLGQGTKSIKTYYTSFEFEERATVSVPV